MAFPTTDMRVKPGSFGLFAKSGYLHAPLEGGCERTGDFAAQAHELAGIGPVDARHRAGAAQVAAPTRSKQAAFFLVAAAIIIAIEIFTFGTRRCFHNPTITI